MATLRSHAYNDCRPLGLYVSFSTFPERTECPRNTPVAGLKGEDMDKHYVGPCLCHHGSGCDDAELCVGGPGR
jgi:hypothetical protein